MQNTVISKIIYYLEFCTGCILLHIYRTPDWLRPAGSLGASGPTLPHQGHSEQGAQPYTLAAPEHLQGGEPTAPGSLCQGASPTQHCGAAWCTGEPPVLQFVPTAP